MPTVTVDKENLFKALEKNYSKLSPTQTTRMPHDDGLVPNCILGFTF